MGVLTESTTERHRNDPKFWNREALTNRPRSKEQSDQGLHCLPIHLHLLYKFFHEKTSLFEFQGN